MSPALAADLTIGIDEGIGGDQGVRGHGEGEGLVVFRAVAIPAGGHMDLARFGVDKIDELSLFKLPGDV